MPHTKLSSSTKAAFYKTYPFPGFDPVDNSRASDVCLLDSELQHYLNHPLTYFSVFCGLRSKIPTDGKQSLKKMFEDMFFWPNKNLSWPKKIAYGIGGGLLGTLYWLIVSLPTMIMNIAKLITEFVPAIGIVYFANKLERYKEIKNPTWKDKLKHAASCTAYGIFRGWHFAGRALTSPVNGMRAAYKDGKKFGGDSKLGTVCGVGLAVLSGTISVVSCFILPKLIIHSISTYAVNIIPAQVKTLFTSVTANAASSGPLATAISAIGQNVTPFMDKITGLASQGPNLLTGLSFIASAFLSGFNTFYAMMRIGVTKSNSLSARKTSFVKNVSHPKSVQKARAPVLPSNQQPHPKLEQKPRADVMPSKNQPSRVSGSTTKVIKQLHSPQEDFYQEKSHQENPPAPARINYSPDAVTYINQRAKEIHQQYHNEKIEERQVTVREDCRNYLKLKYERKESGIDPVTEAEFKTTEFLDNEKAASSWWERARLALQKFDGDTKMDRYYSRLDRHRLSLLNEKLTPQERENKRRDEMMKDKRLNK